MHSRLVEIIFTLQDWLLVTHVEKICKLKRYKNRRVQKRCIKCAMDSLTTAAIEIYSYPSLQLRVHHDVVGAQALDMLDVSGH
jgi:hypothetical protein